MNEYCTSASMYNLGRDVSVTLSLFMESITMMKKITTKSKTIKNPIFLCSQIHDKNTSPTKFMLICIISHSHSEPADTAIPNHRTTYVSYQLTCYPEVILNHCLWFAPAAVRNGSDKDGQTATPCYGACDDRRR